MEVKTWADFGALSKEALDAYTPEDLEALKTSIAENEAKTAADREAQSKKDKELAENYKIRAEKAEKKAKKGDEKEEEEEEKKKSTESTLSSRDAIAIAKANVHEADVDELIEFAQFKKISVSEALKHKTWKTMSSEREEERRSAEVAATKKTPGGTSKTDGATLLEKARKGEDVKEEDVEALVEAQMKAKQAKL